MPNKKTIMIVEDDHDLRESLTGVLEMEDYLVLPALNGREALEILRDEKKALPDLIALDCLMPVLDAKGFMQEFRSIVPAEIQKIPVLLLTAASTGLVGELADTCAKVIQKPIDIDVFLSQIASTLQIPNT